jgi:uncharacterized protein with HEPN domain
MYFEDIILAIERIAEYIEGLSFIRFKRDYKTVDAVIRNFEIIDDAAKNIPAEIKSLMNILALIMKLNRMWL